VDRSGRREHVDLHAAEAQLRLFRDDFAQWQHFALVVARNVVGGAVVAERVARLGADIHRPLSQQVERLIVRLGGLAHPDFSAVVDRNLELDVESAFAERRSFRITSFAIDAGDLEHRHKSASFMISESHSNLL